MASVTFVEANRFFSEVQKIGNLSKLFISLSADGKIACGQNPIDSSHFFDFKQEQFVLAGKAALGGAADNAQDSRQAVAVAPPIDSGRTTGLYTIEIRGRARSYKSLKQLLGETLLMLGENDGEFLERVAHEKTRSRHLIAKKPEGLFDNKFLSSDAVKYAKLLPNGWWLNTNNSTPQVKNWIAVIANAANLNWNRDIRISF
jgi:hypothetical protein